MRLAITAICALLLSAALSATASVQDEQPVIEEPARRSAPRDIRRVTRPSPDEVILDSIRAAVDPSGEQWAQLLILLQEMRSAQRTVMRDVTEEMAPADQGDGENGSRLRPRPRRRSASPDEDTDGPTERDREAFAALRDATHEVMRERLAPINHQFLIDARDLMRDDQLETWDACAAELDLMPGRLRRNENGGIDETAGPSVGAEAPDFVLSDLEGRDVTLSALRGKPVVLQFGSHTCPIFRRKVDEMNVLQEKFSDRVHWILVYTKEAHPANGWSIEINRRQGIEIPQHESIDERSRRAREMVERTAVKFRVLVDTLENAVTTRYAGFPNRGYVLDEDGVVVSKQVWIDPVETRRVLEELLGTNSTDSEQQ